MQRPTALVLLTLAVLHGKAWGEEVNYLPLVASFSSSESVPIHSIGISPNGKILAAGYVYGTVRLWDRVKRTEIALLTPSDSGKSISCLAFSQDGHFIATACDDGSISLWDAVQFTRRDRVVVNSNGFWSMTFSPDSRALVASGIDGVVRVWAIPRLGAGSIFEKYSHPASDVRVSPDGRMLVIAQCHGLVHVYDFSTRKKLQTLIHPPAGGSKISVDFAPAASLLASAGDDCTVRLWDVSTGELQLCLKGHRAYITAVRFSPDGQTLVSIDRNGSAIMWETATGQIVQRCEHPGSLLSMSVSSSGELWAFAGGGGSVFLRQWTLHSTSAVGPPLALSDDHLNSLWSTLGVREPEQAYRAVSEVTSLITSNDASVREFVLAFLKKRVEPRKSSTDTVALLINRLDADDYGIREDAMRQLRNICDLVEPELRAFLEKSRSSEQTARVKDLLVTAKQSIPVPSAEGLRLLRAIHLVEVMGSSERQYLLSKLAGGNDGALETRCAKHLLGR